MTAIILNKNTSIKKAANIMQINDAFIKKFKKSYQQQGGTCSNKKIFYLLEKCHFLRRQLANRMNE